MTSRLILPTSEEEYRKHGLIAELPPHFDNSMTHCFTRCKRLFYYQYILGRRGKKKGHGLLFGSAWHKMQELFALGESLDVVYEACHEFIPEEVDDRYGRTRDRIKDAFGRYLEKYLVADKQTKELIRVELPFDVYCPPDGDCPWGGCGLYHSGKSDKLYREYNRLWLLDYKTSTQKDDYYHEKLIIDPQTIGYGWAMTHLTGEEIWGVVLDRAVINKSKIDFTRYPLSFSMDLMAEWIRDQQQKQAGIRHLFENHPYDMGAWDKSAGEYGECFRFGKCGFYDVCTTFAYPDVGARLKALESEFVEYRHDPYKL